MQFLGLSERLAGIRQRIDEAIGRGGHSQNVVIVAVTKTRGPEAVNAAWAAGLIDVGENRVQEAVEKMERVTEPVRWHLIGHLQRNKARYVDRFALTHSIDSTRLAEAVHAEAVRIGRQFPVLIQVNTSGETAKGGFSLDELARTVEPLKALHGLLVQGVMTMAPLDADESVLRATFAGARSARTLLREAGHPADELSMGMSNDFDVAVEEGATMVRIGTILFGERT
jgi:pyridoxal phosphate enzyme (YggS family)